MQPTLPCYARHIVAFSGQNYAIKAYQPNSFFDLFVSKLYYCIVQLTNFGQNTA